MQHLTILHDKDEVRERRAAARAEFIKACNNEYGYVPFCEEYLDRSWPSD